MPIVADRIRAAASTAQAEPFLRDVSVTLREGEVTVVVGVAGAGKSTLLDALAGLRPLLAGTVTYDGRPLWRRGRVDRDVNRRIGALFQQPGHGLFAATVLRELRYSLRSLRLTKAEEEARIAASLEAVRLPEDVLMRSPFALSGGQQRRVGLAAAVVAEPDWLFLDEPTSALDPAGAAALAEWLRQRRTAAPQCGFVIATHDLDTFLPLADRVLVLERGAIVADETPQTMAERPELLLRAGVGLPDYMETAVLMRRCGWNVAANASAEEMAEVLDGMLKGAGNTLQAAKDRIPAIDPAAGLASERPSSGTASIAYAAAPPCAMQQSAAASVYGAPSPEDTRPSERAGWAHRLDPRIKWLILLLVTAGMLAQHSWSGVAWSAAAAIAIAAAAGLPLRRYGSLLRAYMLFSSISILVSGFRLSAALTGTGAPFDAADALLTGVSLLRFVPAMLLGLLFAQTTSPMELKRGLEQIVPQRGGKGISLPLEMLTFSTALLFRFIPLLSAQWERFSRIVRVRGKSGAKPGRLAARDLPAVLTPLLVASFQLAEQLSLAVEARGYRLGQPRTSSVRLKLTRRDGVALAAGAALAAALWIIR